MLSIYTMGRLFRPSRTAPRWFEVHFTLANPQIALSQLATLILQPGRSCAASGRPRLNLGLNVVHDLTTNMNDEDLQRGTELLVKKTQHLDRHFSVPILKTGPNFDGGDNAVLSSGMGAWAVRTRR